MESFTVRAIRDEEPPFKTEEHGGTGGYGGPQAVRKPSKISREAE